MFRAGRGELTTRRAIWQKVKNIFQLIQITAGLEANTYLPDTSTKPSKPISKTSPSNTFRYSCWRCRRYLLTCRRVALHIRSCKNAATIIIDGIEEVEVILGFEQRQQYTMKLNILKKKQVSTLITNSHF